MDGKPLVFGGKVQQKPLAMLKAIIALGGRDVDGESLVDALWPEAEGDHGRSSFDTTLHRLRKLLSNEKIIQFGDGKVSLDERYCRVDAWAFEKLIEGASPVLDFGTGNENLKNRLPTVRSPQSAIRNREGSCSLSWPFPGRRIRTVGALPAGTFAKQIYKRRKQAWPILHGVRQVRKVR